MLSSVYVKLLEHTSYQWLHKIQLCLPCGEVCQNHWHHLQRMRDKSTPGKNRKYHIRSVTKRDQAVWQPGSIKWIIAFICNRYFRKLKIFSVLTYSISLIADPSHVRINKSIWWLNAKQIQIYYCTHVIMPYYEL